MRTVNLSFHSLLDVPAGNGKGILQGKLSPTEYLVSQSATNSGTSNLGSWRLMMITYENLCSEGFAYVRFKTPSGIKCKCRPEKEALPAVASVGRWDGKKFDNIQDVCEGCLEEMIYQNQ